MFLPNSVIKVSWVYCTLLGHPRACIYCWIVPLFRPSSCTSAVIKCQVELGTRRAGKVGQILICSMNCFSNERAALLPFSVLAISVFLLRDHLLLLCITKCLCICMVWAWLSNEIVIPLCAVQAVAHASAICQCYRAGYRSNHGLATSMHECSQSVCDLVVPHASYAPTFLSLSTRLVSTHCCSVFTFSFKQMISLICKERRMLLASCMFYILKCDYLFVIKLSAFASPPPVFFSLLL